MCFQATCEDLRALGGDGRVTRDAIERLLTAFLRGTPSDWRRAVRAIDALVTASPASAAPSAQRLTQFVVENADLLVA